MAETKNGPENGTRTPETRAAEVGVVARAMVTEKAAAVGRSMKSADQLTPAEGALHVVNILQTFQDKDNKLEFTDDSLKMKGFSEEGFDFKDNETSIAEISGVTDDGYLICTLRDKNGDIVQKQDGSGPQYFGRLREDVVDAQIYSEKSLLLPEFDGDDKKLLRTHVDTLPQNANPAKPGPEADAVIEQAAERFGITKLEDVHTFADNLSLEQMGDGDFRDAVQALKGRKIVTTEEFAHIIALSGEDVDSLTGKVDSLQGELDQLNTEEGTVNALPDTDPTKQGQLDRIKQNREDAQKKKRAFEAAHKIVKDEADAEDKRAAAELKAQQDREAKIATPEADAEIASQINYLKAELEAEQNKDPKDLTPTELKQRDERVRFLKGHLGTMQLASMANGEAGAFFKLGAINAAIARAGAGTAEARVLEGIRDNLLPQSETAKNYLRNLVDNAGLDAGKHATVKAALEASNGNLAELLSSGISDVDGFAEGTFGAELTGDEARGIDKLKMEAVMNLADAHGMTEQQKMDLKKKLLAAGKVGGIAILLAAIASIAVVGAGAVMMGQQQRAG